MAVISSNSQIPVDFEENIRVEGKLAKGVLKLTREDLMLQEALLHLAKEKMFEVERAKTNQFKARQLDDLEADLRDLKKPDSAGFKAVKDAKSDFEAWKKANPEAPEKDIEAELQKVASVEKFFKKAVKAAEKNFKKAVKAAERDIDDNKTLADKDNRERVLKEAHKALELAQKACVFAEAGMSAHVAYLQWKADEARKNLAVLPVGTPERIKAEGKLAKCVLKRAEKNMGMKIAVLRIAEERMREIDKAQANPLADHELADLEDALSEVKKSQSEAVKNAKTDFEAEAQKVASVEKAFKKDVKAAEENIEDHKALADTEDYRKKVKTAHKALKVAEQELVSAQAGMSAYVAYLQWKNEEAKKNLANVSAQPPSV